MGDTEIKHLAFLLEYKNRHFEYKRGYTEEQVSALETSLHIKFPAAYRELYMLFGEKMAFGIVEENSYKFPDYEGMRRATKDKIDLDGVELELTDNIFVFSYSEMLSAFVFFYLDQGDDPPVYEYLGMGEIEKVADHFTDYIRNMLL